MTRTHLIRRRMSRIAVHAALVVAIAPCILDGPLCAAPISGRVVDARTSAAVQEALVTVGSSVVRAGTGGEFTLDVPSDYVVRVRAPGYLRRDLTPAELLGSGHQVMLTPFRPKALYLSLYGIGDKQLRGAALELIDKTELNAVVIDMKGDRGLVPFRTSVAAGVAPDAQRVITISDLPALVTSLKSRGIYTIARMVLFKDSALAAAQPVLAIRRPDGTIYKDREGLNWVNPYSPRVWQYNIDLARETARAGFDEIQFDYARLPDATGLAYERPWTRPDREAAVEGFLTEARAALVPFNVFLSVDVFGYICWNVDDTRIGQTLEHLVRIVDYVSPMLYPSGFQFGIPGYRNPVEHPYEVVRLSLERARQRTGMPAVHLRPWLQAFRDYAFGGRWFDADEVNAQIRAAEDVGTGGWMLWNPENRYSSGGLRP